MTELSLTLEQCEDGIEKAMEAAKEHFSVIGKHLTVIRDNGLWQENYASFEIYCGERWGFGQSYAYRLMSAVKVLEQLSPRGEKPETEKQLRAISESSSVPEIRQAVWSETQRDTGKQQPTPLEIKTTAVAVVRRTMSEIIESAKPKNQPKPETLVIDGHFEGLVRAVAKCQKLIEELQQAVDVKAKASPREMASITKSLKAKIESAGKPLPGVAEELEKLVGSWKNYRKQVDDL